MFKKYTSILLSLVLAFSIFAAPVFSADQRIQYTEEMVGASHPTKSDTLNRHGLVGHNADGTHKAGLGDLLNGAANLKAFMNAGATAPEWASGIKIVAYTRDLTAAAGDVSYIGAGFKPSAIIVIGAIEGGHSFVGFSDFSNSYSISEYAAGTWSWGISRCLSYWVDATHNQRATTKTADADGCTLTWDKLSTPSGTLTFSILYIR